MLSGKPAVSCNLQSAIAGLNPYLRDLIAEFSSMQVMLIVKSNAITHCEMCQDRKVAAISSQLDVPLVNLA